MPQLPQAFPSSPLLTAYYSNAVLKQRAGSSSISVAGTVSRKHTVQIHGPDKWSALTVSGHDYYLQFVRSSAGVPATV